MRKILLAFLPCFTAAFVFGQTLGLEPNPVYVTGQASSSVIEAHVDITNNTGAVVDMLWERFIVSAPPGWQVQICDKQLCYLPHVTKCPENYPNNLQPGETMEMRVDILPGGIEGKGTIKVNLFDIKDTTNILGMVEAHFELGTTAVGEPGKEPEVKIYPNPATEYFQILNPAQVSSVQIYNIVGSRLHAQPVSGSEKISIGHLPDGMYLVRLFGTDNRVLKTIRLSKR